MKKIFLLSVLAFAISLAKAQYISEIIEYTPAPGQFINKNPGWPKNAESIKGPPEKNGRMVSLGFWGGYIIVGFDEPIENHPDNPYGVDFTIFGNAFQGSSEPGIVQVMKDENGNGLPDDTWYELMGSDHHLSTTKYDYAITYTNPNGKYDVPWVDNEGNEGIVRYMQEFHTQEHYPSADSFPHINQDNYTLYGTLLKHKSTQSVKDGMWVNLDFDYGYVDNKSFVNNSHITDWFLTPDNPYTLDAQEGCGGDAFDIHWAIDADGNHVDLDSIHWVKVYNGVAQNAGWLGENSTEVSGIADAKPNPDISGVVHTIVSNQPPHAGGFPVADNLTWHTGDDFQFESHVVYMGRKRYPDMPANHKITWESSDDDVATISENGLLSPQNEGNVTITAKWEDPDDPVAVIEMDSVVVDSIVGRTGTTYIWETFYTGIYRQYNINIEAGGVDAIVANDSVIGDITGKPGDSLTYDLDGLFTDPNDPDAEFIYLVFGGHDMTIADAEIADGKITFELKSVGDIGIIIKCQANGKMGQTTIPVSVRNDEPSSIIANDIMNDITGKPGDSLTYDLDGLFTDPDDPDAEFTYQVFEGHDISIADAEIADGKITFELKSVGDIGIVIKCQANGKMGQTTIPVSVRNDEPTSIATNNSSDKEYAVYPNPASNFINIKNAARVNIEVFNILGIKVGELSNYSYGQAIYVGHLKQGVYLITINTGTDIKTLKFQKQ
jgi:hypothetical protein